MRSGYRFRTGLLRLVIAAMAATVFAPAAAESCTCAGSLGLCAGVRTADAVFVATVDSIVLEDRGRADGLISSADPLIVTLRDVDPVRGDSSDVVITAAGGASCGYTFEPGVRYLIVARRSADGRLTVSQCSLTRPAAEAAGLLDYARTLDGDPSQTLVWGQVRMPVAWSDSVRDYQPIPAARVSVSGAASHTLATDGDGRFRIAGLPYGEYALTVEWPDDRPYLSAAPPIELVLDEDVPYACQEIGVLAPIDSSISGVVLDQAGQPAAGVFVQLGLADQTDLSRGRAGMGFTTGPDGRYRFDDLPPGRYLVGLHVPTARGDGGDAAVRPTEPRPEPAVVSLALGQHLTLPPIRSRQLAIMVATAQAAPPSATSRRSRRDSERRDWRQCEGVP
jgi:hypothetical protein